MKEVLIEWEEEGVGARARILTLSDKLQPHTTTPLTTNQEQLIGLSLLKERLSRAEYGIPHLAWCKRLAYTLSRYEGPPS